MARARTSAGILLYRRRDRMIEVFLVHPGGPFWAKRDAGAWTIPKGELGEDEEALAGARREFLEETGFAPAGPFVALAAVKQAGGKTVLAFAAEGDCDPAAIRSNLFAMEWPPRSGRQAQFPEVDRAAWFALAEAKERIFAGQAPLLAQLESLIASP